MCISVLASGILRSEKVTFYFDKRNLLLPVVLAIIAWPCTVQNAVHVAAYTKEHSCLTFELGNKINPNICHVDVSVSCTHSNQNGVDHGSDCDGDASDMMAHRVLDTEEECSAFHGAASLHSSCMFHIKISKIQCLKWKKFHIDQEIHDSFVWIMWTLTAWGALVVIWGYRRYYIINRITVMISYNEVMIRELLLYFRCAFCLSSEKNEFVHIVWCSFGRYERKSHDTSLHLSGIACSQSLESLSSVWKPWVVT